MLPQHKYIHCMCLIVQSGFLFTMERFMFTAVPGISTVAHQLFNTCRIDSYGLKETHSSLSKDVYRQVDKVVNTYKRQFLYGDFVTASIYLISRYVLGLTKNSKKYQKLHLGHRKLTDAWTIKWICHLQHATWIMRMVGIFLHFVEVTYWWILLASLGIASLAHW